MRCWTTPSWPWAPPGKRPRGSGANGFPGFSGQNTVNRAKPGARVLAFNADQSNDYGPLVVFAVQQIGRGRTMAFTSDTTQSWGSRFHTKFGTPEDPNLYYRRFWNQAVRWLAADRIRRKSGELRVHAGPRRRGARRTRRGAHPVPAQPPRCGRHPEAGVAGEGTDARGVDPRRGDPHLACRGPDGDRGRVDLHRAHAAARPGSALRPRPRQRGPGHPRTRVDGGQPRPDGGTGPDRRRPVAGRRPRSLVGGGRSPAAAASSNTAGGRSGTAGG